MAASSPLGDRPDLLAQPFCYLTTKGRRTGLLRTVELWFAGEDDRVYVVSGGGLRSDWVRNLMREPAVLLTIGGLRFPARARVLDRERDAEAWTRGAELCARKYYRRGGAYLARGWSPEAVVVEFTVAGPGVAAGSPGA